VLIRRTAQVLAGEFEQEPGGRVLRRGLERALCSRRKARLQPGEVRRGVIGAGENDDLAIQQCAIGRQTPGLASSGNAQLRSLPFLLRS
jgi:hypothetical protein